MVIDTDWAYYNCWTLISYRDLNYIWNTDDRELKEWSGIGVLEPITKHGSNEAPAAINLLIKQIPNGFLSQQFNNKHDIQVGYRHLSSRHTCNTSQTTLKSPHNPIGFVEILTSHNYITVPFFGWFHEHLWYPEPLQSSSLIVDALVGGWWRRRSIAGSTRTATER